MEHHGGLAFVRLGPSTPTTSSIPDCPSPDSPLPCVICFHGSGHSSHYETWKPLVEHISRRAPVLFYERSGVGESAGPLIQPPQESVKSLIDLLKHVNLSPPYILVAHSYGGTFAREFLQQYPSHVAGMVLAETGQETPTAYDEEQYRKCILDSKPLSVIHAKGLSHKPAATQQTGSSSPAGTEMLRRWREEDERLKKAQLRLSRKTMYVCVENCGHNVVRDRPDVVDEAVGWVLDNLVLFDPEEVPNGLRAALSRLVQHFPLRSRSAASRASHATVYR